MYVLEIYYGFMRQVQIQLLNMSIYTMLDLLIVMTLVTFLSGAPFGKNVCVIIVAKTLSTLILTYLIGLQSPAINSNFGHNDETRNQA